MRQQPRPRSGAADSAPLFAALGDPTRLELLARLSDGRAHSITRLSRGLRLTRQAVTKHLRVLAVAGLATSASAGRESLWTLAPRRLGVALQYLELMAARWDRRLEALKSHLEDAPD